jgi:hypothetical protein
MDSYNLELAGAAAGQRVQLAASSIVRMQFNSTINEPDDATAVMSLANGDTLVGSLTGQLRLQTEFDTIAINCGEIKPWKHSRLRLPMSGSSSGMSRWWPACSTSRCWTCSPPAA